jgi:MFS family permease
MPAMPPAWSPDAWIVFAAKTARTFCYGFLGILLPVYLSELGAGAGFVGLTVSLTLAASALLTWAVRRPAERHGARAALLALAALSLGAAALLLLARAPWLVVLAAMLGNVAVGAGETGPFLTLEQVVVSRAVARERLPLALSLYNLIGYAAAGVGAAVTALLSAPALFAVFAAGALVQMAAYAGLGGASRPAARRSLPLSALPSAPVIRRLAALFALDSLAGGFVLQSLVAYWLYVRWGLRLESLGVIFFAAQALTALSLLAAAPLARRVGLVNTMVFTHLVSNVFLVAMALAPSAAAAVGLLLARQLLSQMDVPTRQAYVMSVVEDHERESAASATNLSRTIAQALTPTVTGWVMQAVAVSAPFVLGGGLKIVYDLLLYATFRKVKPRAAA